MGHSRFTRDAYRRVEERVRASGGVEAHAKEERKQQGGKTNPLVDPKAFGLIRRSLPRYTQRADGLWVLSNGTPMAYRTRFDTTSSMGDNVDLAFRVLPQSYDLVSAVLPRYDLQMGTDTFGDAVDPVVLYRSQFEMAERIAEQLAMQEPGRGGGDITEDPDYGLFGAAYLTAAHINGYGLRYYDLTVTDAPFRGCVTHETLVRVFGETVYDVAEENGHTIDRSRLPNTNQIVSELVCQAHAFVLLIGNSGRTYSRGWIEAYGKERVIFADSTRHLPYYQALIAGLTEGTLNLRSALKFLLKHGCDKATARALVRSVVHIPLGAQRLAENFDKIPPAGSIFREKTDLWPVDPSEVADPDGDEKEGGVDWVYDVVDA